MTEEQRERKRASQKAWRENNKESIKKSNKAYSSANREAKREYDRAYEKKKRETDPLYNLRKSIRASSYRSFKGEAKSKTTEKLIGCTYNDFKDYITSQFVGEMNWDNYGQLWHVDHIIPLAVIEDVSQTELISSLCHFTNLQPLFAADNHLKRSKLDYQYPDIYKSNLLHNSNKK
jgi:uncharacterized protein YktA (UPF0223 family)